MINVDIQETDPEINPEFEEKPIVEKCQEISEDYHGGNEITFSMEVDNRGGLESSKDDSKSTNDVSDDSNTDSEDYDSGGERQTNRSVNVYYSPTTRKLRTLFQRFIERIAEVETKYEIPNETQKLSVKQLMLRTLNKRSLKRCYVDTHKETVILLIDTSGSMDWWVEILSKITTIALERKDIEIYEAPNGLITRPVRSWNLLGEYYDWPEYEKFHDEFMRKTRNRVIIYVGDFDGGDTPYELATIGGNKVYWICNESRYWDTSDHNWCSHSLDEYPDNCKILWAYDEQDLIKVFSGQKTEQQVEDDWDEMY